MSMDPTELNEVTLGEMLRGLDKATLVDLVQFFTEETRKAVPRMRPLLEARDFTELKREAHSLKGSSRTYGATGYGEIAYNLEQASKDEDAEQAAKWLGDVEDGMETALVTLNAYVETLPEG